MEGKGGGRVERKKREKFLKVLVGGSESVVIVALMLIF